MRFPNSWMTASIGDLFDIGAGKMVNAGARTGDPKHPFLRTSNVLWGRLDLSEVDCMHFVQEELRTKTLRPGDLLVCEGGDIGRAAIWNGEIKDCGFQNHLHRLRPKRRDIVPKFFMYALQAGFTLHRSYEGAGNRTTIPNLSRSRLAALHVPTPPAEEQARIAAVLSLVQRAIETEEQGIATTRELKQLAMQKLFSSGLRPEVPDGTSAVEHNKGEPRVQLADLFSIKHGYAFAGERFASNGEYVLLTPGHFKEEGGFRNLGEKTKYYAGAFPPDYLLQVGDLLVAMTEQKPGLLGSSVLVPRGRAYLHNQRLGLVVNLDSQRLDKRFLYHLFNTPTVRAELARTATGSKVKHTSPGRILDLMILLPQLEEQREIANALDKIDSARLVFERRLATLREIFMTLLDELFTGSIRVDNLDIATSTVAVA